MCVEGQFSSGEAVCWSFSQSLGAGSEAVVRCEELGSLANHRLVSPSAERNRAPISEVLSQVLPERGVVLEISSGTGSMSFTSLAQCRT